MRDVALLDENLSAKQKLNDVQFKALFEKLREGLFIRLLPDSMRGASDSEIADYAYRYMIRVLITQDKDFLRKNELNRPFRKILLVQRVPPTTTGHELRVIEYERTEEDRQAGKPFRKGRIWGITSDGRIIIHRE